MVLSVGLSPSVGLAGDCTGNCLIVIDDPLPSPNPILLPVYGGGDSGGGGLGPPGGGGLPETKSECNNRIDNLVDDCELAVVIGAAYMGGSFCLVTGIVASFFLTPAGGAVVGAACSAAGGVTGFLAGKKCAKEGTKQRINECPI